MRFFWFALFFFSFASAEAITLDRWPGSGYPVFLYKEDKIKLFQDTDIEGEKKEEDVILGERVDFGLSRIVVKENGILSPNRPFYLNCEDKEGNPLRTRIEPPKKLQILYMSRFYILSQYEDRFCDFVIKEPDPLVFYEVIKPPKSEWWIEVHLNQNFKKGWVQVNDENLVILPRIPSNKNHNNRRGVTGDYRVIKIVSRKDEPKVRGFFNYWVDYDPIEDKFKGQCFFFFEGPLVNQIFEIEAFFPKKKRRILGQLKYNWRGDQSHLIIQLKKRPPDCSGEDSQIVEEPRVFDLIREGVWRDADLLKTKVKLAFRPDRRTLTDHEIDKFQPVVILQGFRDWVLAEGDPPHNRRGWIHKDDLFGAEKPPVIDCEGFEENTGLPFEYLSLSCEAQKSLEKKEYEKAEAFYFKALQIKLKDEKGKPIPNYSLYENIADLRCAQNKKVESELIRKDLLCMKRVEQGLLSCFLESEGEEQQTDPVPNPQLSTLCSRTMCKKPYVENYRPFAGSSNQRQALMKSLATETEKSCAP